MIKGLEALNEMLNMDLGLVRTNRNKKGEDYKIINKELKVLAIISKYITMNRAFKDQTKGKSDMTLIEIKALIPDEEYDLVKEVLK